LHGTHQVNQCLAAVSAKVVVVDDDTAAVEQQQLS